MWQDAWGKGTWKSNNSGDEQQVLPSLTQVLSIPGEYLNFNLIHTVTRETLKQKIKMGEISVKWRLLILFN